MVPLVFMLAGGDVCLLWVAVEKVGSRKSDAQLGYDLAVFAVADPLDDAAAVFHVASFVWSGYVARFSAISFGFGLLRNLLFLRRDVL